MPRTILVYLDVVIHSHDELFVGLIESSCNISRQFRTYYIQVVPVPRVQQV